MNSNIPATSYTMNNECFVVILNYGSVDTDNPPKELLINVHYAVIKCWLLAFKITEDTTMFGCYDCTADVTPIDDVPEWCEEDAFDEVDISEIMPRDYYPVPKIEDYL